MKGKQNSSGKNWLAGGQAENERRRQSPEIQGCAGLGKPTIHSKAPSIKGTISKNLCVKDPVPLLS